MIVLCARIEIPLMPVPITAQMGAEGSHRSPPRICRKRDGQENSQEHGVQDPDEQAKEQHGLSPPDSEIVSKDEECQK